MRPQNHLVIFARVPRMGTGKRRLAADIGAAEALRFQRQCLAATLRKLAPDRRWKTWLALAPHARSHWGSEAFTLPQPRGDLGRRMGRVAQAMPPGPVVIIGSDIPGIARRHIARAFRDLGGNDAVFGPASDGGYWLVGLRRRPRFVDPFANVRWSTPHALADTTANLGGYRFALLDMLDDIDTGADLRQLTQRSATR
ncbi:TIGR04282 family arsenosugar biosynthesis glycosyltransferase [Ferrovibrio sp.]|uniref:TIGR04282 family arsenosugar biosynthesis glycosyltransferase n=1 Tax=Ferrovibrio sp. TaxID=1917215 RepID=UPI00262140F8|nr:TIGR04282 family arsenosugar biosynthesis glycosyltransferase [Ferrovibrio sp.]